MIGASRRLLDGSQAPDRQSPREGESQDAAAADARSKRGDLITYGVGYALALGLTCAAFALADWRWASGMTTVGIVFALALVQAVVHFRCFLHVDLKRSARDDLQLILFSTLIVALMVGGTLVVLLNLRTRMM